MTNHRSNLLAEIPDLTLTDYEGKTLATMPGPFGLPITCAYWREENVRPGEDQWRFSLASPTTKYTSVGPFSHPSEIGCQIAIRRYFLDIGLIPVPEDNTHLDEVDRVIAATIERDYGNRADRRPREGDFAMMPDGSLRRCCHAHEHGMQTTFGGSFSTGKGGYVSYSGSLEPSTLWESFEDTGETRRGRFWFFSHGQAGAGRGVDVFLTCRVYRVVLKPLTEEQAKAHPLAIRAAEIWGEQDRDYKRTVENLMKGLGG